MSDWRSNKTGDPSAATLFPSTPAINASPAGVITQVIFRAYFVCLRTG